MFDALKTQDSLRRIILVILYIIGDWFGLKLWMPYILPVGATINYVMVTHDIFYLEDCPWTMFNT